MIEKIYGDFKIYSQAVIRSISAQLSPEPINCYHAPRGREWHLELYSGEIYYISDEEIKEAFDNNIPIGGLTCLVIKDITENMPVHVQSPTWANNLRTFYQLILDSSIETYNESIVDCFNPIDYIYVALIKDVSGVFYEAKWNTAKDEFEITYY